MPVTTRLRSTWRTVFGRREQERELDEELESVLTMLEAENLRLGMSREEARRAARVAFGGVEQVKEEVRQARVGSGLRSFVLDVRYAARNLRRKPAFAAAAILTLALGLGTTITFFSILDAVVLRPLPFPEPDELVRLYEVTPQGGRYTTSQPTFLDWRSMAKSFAEMGAFTGAALDLTGVAEPVTLRGHAVSQTLPAMLGVQVLLGRGFTAAEDTPAEAGNVVILGKAIWERAFGGDREMVGRTVRLGGRPRTVVGVADLGSMRVIDGWPCEVLVPLGADPAGARSNHYIVAVGRLAAGVTLPAAQAEMAALAARIGVTAPQSNGGWGAQAVPARDWLLWPSVARQVELLLAAVGLLLVLTCANVSGLLIAQGTARLGELGMKVTLGASRGRIVRQLLTESLVLASLAGAVGLGMARLAIPVVRALGPAELPRVQEVSLSPTVLAFALGTTVLAALLAGLVPALQLSRRSLAQTLRSHAPTVATGSRVREGLVVGQLALATVVLVAAGLLGRSFLRLASVHPGFATDQVLAVRIGLPSSLSERELEVTWAEVGRRLAAAPGVAAVGATLTSPFGDGETSNRVSTPDRNPRSPEDFVAVQFRLVTEGFFSALQIPLLRGQPLDTSGQAGIREGEQLRVLVSRGLAERLWPGADPVGREVYWQNVEGPRFRVAGVVGDIRDRWLAAPPPPMLYLPLSAWPQAKMTLLVRTVGSAAELAPAIRDELRRLAPDSVVPFPTPLAAGLVRATAGPAFLTRLFALFGVLALLIASTGVYAVGAAQVAGRRGEIGIRMALGADRRTILAMVLHQGVRRMALGLGIGLAAGLGAGRLLSSILFETRPSDPLAFATVLAVLGAAGLTATLVPAIRASRVDPRAALAAE